METPKKGAYIRSVTGIDYQRNGISGEGFWQVFFRDTDGRHLIGVVFDEEKTVAVLDPLDVGDHFRGDNFEIELRTLISKEEIRRYGSRCFNCDSVPASDTFVINEKSGRLVCTKCDHERR